MLPGIFLLMRQNSEGEGVGRGGGRGLVAMGTQPMAAALANGSHAATEARLLGAMVQVTAS